MTCLVEVGRERDPGRRINRDHDGNGREGTKNNDEAGALHFSTLQIAVVRCRGVAVSEGIKIGI